MAEMMNVTETGDPNHKYYGLGCFYNPGLGYGHNGGTWGYLSLMRYDPENDVAIATFMNKISSDLLALANVLYNVSYTSKNILGYAPSGDNITDNSSSISGAITYLDDYQSGKIYVLALKAEAENKGKIREMETEPYPFHSQYVYRYTILEGPGFYRIPELEEGEYIL